MNSTFKILIIRFSSIGDIVLTTPLIRIIASQYPKFEIHYLTKLMYKDLVDCNPYIDKVHYLDHNFRPLMHELKKENFNYIIDLHNNLRSNLIQIILNRACNSIQKLRFKRFLLIHFKKKINPPLHIVNRYLQTANILDIFDDREGLDFFLPKNYIFNNAANLEGNYMVFSISASYFTKKLPVHKIISIINEINFNIVLIGGKEDIEIAAEIIQKSTNKNIKNFVGIGTLLDSAFIIKNSKAIISFDTGMQHIASAFKKKIFAIWGSTTPDLLMEPLLPNNTNLENLHENFIVPNLACQPCSVHGKNKCPKKHFNCMELQNVGLITNQINNYLNLSH